METIHIWVGTDEWQRAAGAERVLEHSIRKHASRPVEIHWMRGGDAGWEVSKNGDNGSWRINMEPGNAWKVRGAWGTTFSCFRFTIPEMMGFVGKAIYFDADMLVRDDVAKLIDMETTAGYRCISDARTDVSVIDCAWFKDKAWWPSIAKMKPSGWIVWHYCQLLAKHKGVEPTLPKEWNDCDGLLFQRDPGLSKLVHYTSVPDGQPYCPYPTINYHVPYPHARNAQAGQLWWSTFRESLGPEGVQELREALVEAGKRAEKRVLSESDLRQVLLRSGVPEEEATVSP